MFPLLSIQDLHIQFTTEGKTTTAVDHVSLRVARGEILALVGESGSGKSVTALSILQLLPRPPAQYAGGSVFFAEGGENPVDLLSLPEDRLQSIRGNRIAMIFQEPMTSLNPVMRCGDQVVEALMAHQKMPLRAARKLAIQWMEKVQLPQPGDMYYRYPHQLSGGQKQRVMIAVAMCCRPSLLICDEPTTALDVTVQQTILRLIRDLQQEHGMGVIFITHDLGVVREVADRVAIMYRGRIVEENSTALIFTAPRHPYTKALIACRPASHPKGERLPVVADFLEDKKTAAVVEQASGSIPVTTNETLVAVEGLTVQFPGKRNLLGRPREYFTAVKNVSFTIRKGETLGLVGESGCGKTTLGRTLLRLIPPASGTILYEGRDITRLEGPALRALRREIQLVFQDPYASLNPRLDIGTALTEPIRVARTASSAKERKERAARLLEQVNLSPAMLDRYPHEFSGGQRQRIVIARALGPGPRFLVCDESVSALDVSVQAQVLNLLNDLKKDLGLTLLFISHDLSVVRYMSDRIMVMKEGTIVETGAAEAIYNNPQHPYTQQLVQSIPRL